MNLWRTKHSFSSSSKLIIIFFFFSSSSFISLSQKIPLLIPSTGPIETSLLAEECRCLVLIEASLPLSLVFSPRPRQPFPHTLHGQVLLFLLLVSRDPSIQTVLRTSLEISAIVCPTPWEPSPLLSSQGR